MIKQSLTPTEGKYFKNLVGIGLLTLLSTLNFFSIIIILFSYLGIIQKFLEMKLSDYFLNVKLIGGVFLILYSLDFYFQRHEQTLAYRQFKIAEKLNLTFFIILFFAWLAITINIVKLPPAASLMLAMQVAIPFYGFLFISTIFITFTLPLFFILRSLKKKSSSQNST